MITRTRIQTYFNDDTYISFECLPRFNLMITLIVLCVYTHFFQVDGNEDGSQDHLQQEQHEQHQRMNHSFLIDVLHVSH